MSSASGAWFWSLGFSDLYNVGLHIVAKCVSEVNTFLVGHQAALKEKAMMKDRLLQAEKALTLANEKLILKVTSSLCGKLSLTKMINCCRSVGRLVFLEPNATAWRAALLICRQSSLALVRIWLKFRLVCLCFRKQQWKMCFCDISRRFSRH